VAKDLFGRLQDELESREEEEKEEESTMMDTLNLSAPSRKIMTTIIRRGELSLAEIAAEMKSTPREVEPLLNALLEKKFLQVEGSGDHRRYKPSLGRKRRRRIPIDIWDTLDGKLIK
jgi:DNA-binding MarR family transcriptional regulator